MSACPRFLSREVHVHDYDLLCPKITLNIMVAYSPGDSEIPHGGATPWPGSHPPGTPGVDVEISVTAKDISGFLDHDYDATVGEPGSGTWQDVHDWVNP